MSGTTPSNKKNTIAIVPAYNEEETIGEVVVGIKKYLNKVIVINDGSVDDTTQEAIKSGAEVIEHLFNVGVGGAQKTGYKIAEDLGYKYIIQLDGDSQHDPEYIPQLMTEISKSDMVVGSRYLNQSFKKYPLIRRMGIKFFTWIVKKIGKTNLSDVTSGYRAYKTETIKKLTPISDKHWAVEQTLEAVRKGLRIEEVSIEMPPRNKGNSQFNTKILIWYPVRMFEIIFRIILFR